MSFTKNIQRYTSPFYFLPLLAFVSCTSQQQIFLYQDGSANVRPTIDTPDQEDVFYKSNIISDILWNNKTGLGFNIKTIDSLGNYLSPVYNKDIFKFTYKHDTLTIVQKNEPTLKKEYEGFFSSIIVIRPDKKIKKVISKNGCVRHTRKKVTIGKPIWYHKKKVQSLHIVIVFNK